MYVVVYNIKEKTLLRGITLSYACTGISELACRFCLFLLFGL